MVFSSPLFLFLFLPLLLICYALLPLRCRNGLLLCFSLLFYAWGEPIGILWLLGSIGWNYVAGLQIGRTEGQARFRWLWIGITANLALLGYFKYTNFLIDQLNSGLFSIGGPLVRHDPVTLLLGISFFTFQAISYLVDVYRDEVQPQRRLDRLALYIALFPQLIAGPIVRYQEIESELAAPRKDELERSLGFKRFILGLAKKVLIADTLGRTADTVFGMEPELISTQVAWLGLLCYSLQILYDFAGYSDMAIGLGQIFGFRFPENFLGPYRADSMRGFWRRWHQTLSRWFRDYVYIPLGGNRGSQLRTGLNLLIVFALCGLWHGAAWNFLLWGLYHGSFLLLERWWSGHIPIPRLVRHAYVLLVVMLGWVLFRSPTLSYASKFYRVLFAPLLPGENATGPNGSVGLYSYPLLWLMLIVGIVGLLPWGAWCTRSRNRLRGMEETGYLLLLLVTMLFVASSTYSPFIYFRF
ncbi:Peptidoglycan O-acetyltransferase [Polystyrenella longa]|uniref:Peptidoglycan O-acetyltransferase n=1 Tax=Polystyrenella longa TaxID=2528007 RepID=A0A518CPV4_9PLAN|nr:MBOAT family protein [Polystyrenella longa]QDU81255.1 Peptidoglycan O-acetyltransferase [Polystyrenella longa]